MDAPYRIISPNFFVNMESFCRPNVTGYCRKFSEMMWVVVSAYMFVKCSLCSFCRFSLLSNLVVQKRSYGHITCHAGHILLRQICNDLLLDIYTQFRLYGLRIYGHFAYMDHFIPIFWLYGLLLYGLFAYMDRFSLDTHGPYIWDWV